MKLLIEPPTWLGDAVMASGAIDKLIDELKPSKTVLYGSFLSLELLKENKRINKTVVKKGYKNIFDIEKTDTFISFRRSFFSKLISLKAKKSFFFENIKTHQVVKYSSFVNKIISKDGIYAPKLHFKKKNFSKPTLGINPGATYGSAKRWYPKEFAKVANKMANKYNIIIFGGPGEEEITKDIEKNLTVKNYQNLCGKLSIKELCKYIGGLSLFITNDSGPMHIASAYKIPTFALFGPTKCEETAPWGSDNAYIIKNDIECSPCMKRECPLKHHKCLKDIKADFVISKIKYHLSLGK